MLPYIQLARLRALLNVNPRVVGQNDEQSKIAHSTFRIRYDTRFFV
jgi:hypothetical protein